VVYDTEFLRRLVVGAAASGAVAIFARATGSLSTTGAWAAVEVGTAAIMGGYAWGVLLVAFFVTSSALSHWGRARKEARTESLLEKGSTRDGLQVLANGGVFAIAALAAAIFPELRESIWKPLGAGALAAAAADTWATEIGILIGGQPRSLVGWKVIPAGTSGGITLSGTLASLSGAVFMGAMCIAVGWSVNVMIAAVIGGILGAFGDSLLGATVQSQRWCDRCDKVTEREVHVCGELTRHYKGWVWMTNDTVNAACTLIGGTAALVITQLLR
jgi:uncharacterized protein (TIGR00297 family)